MPHRDWSAGTRLKLRHLQLVAAVGSQGNLGAAARRLNITQPAASRLLAEVEALVGAPIFERLPRGLSPNIYGEVVVRCAQNLLVRLRETGDELDLLRSGFGGKVTLGVVNEPAVDVAASVLTKLLKSHPGLHLTVCVEPSMSLVKRLLEGEIDIVLARILANLETNTLEYKEIGRERLVFVVRNDHRLANKDGVRLADLENEYWSMEPPGTLLRKTVNDTFRSARITPPTRVINSPSFIFVLSTILEGDIIGVIPSAFAKLIHNDERYCVLKLEESHGYIAVEPYGLIRDLSRPLSPAAGFVYDTIHDALF